MSLIQEIMIEIKAVIDKIDGTQMNDFITGINQSKRIFVDGEGRSGLQAKGFAMRLMHLGYEVYVVGETITPALKTGDIFIAVSGSGTSKNVVADTEKAVQAGAQVLVVTSKPESVLGKLAQTILVVPGTVRGDAGVKRGSIQLLSSLFDQTIHIVLDTVCLMISRRDAISNDEATGGHW